MKAIKNFLKIYSDKTYKYSTVVTHKGKTIAFAMDDKQVIYYSVLDLDNRDEDKSSLDVNYWLNNPRVLQFSNEIATVGYGIVDPKQIPLIKKGTEDEADSGTLRPEEIDPFLSTTARFTADVPFQIMKAGLGFSQETEAGFVVATQVTDIMSVIGTHSIFESSQGMLSEASVTYGYNKSKVSRLDFRGA